MAAPGRQDTGIACPDLTEPLDILFVDDDPLLREFATVNLGAGGGTVTLAADGEEALAALRVRNPGLVILDLQMPKVDGFAVLRALRMGEATRRLPVIVITGRDDVASIDRAFSEGASAFLVKPINWRLLAYQIRYVHRAAQTELDLAAHVREIECKKSELEATAAELARALHDAAAASEAKSQFLATMSHELRTPLNAIIGFSEVLDTRGPGAISEASSREYIRAIRNSGAQLLALINDILEFSRVSSGKLALSEDEFAVAEVVEEAVQAISQQAKAGNVLVSTEGVADDMHLHADHHRVRQILTNLLVNAVKFTPPGGRVAVRAACSGAGLAITVSDTGIGIAAEDIPKVLEQFGQVESHLSRKFGGAGLGLPLAKQLIEQHGGTLEIESTRDVGTNVTVTFPERRVVRAAVTA